MGGQQLGEFVFWKFVFRWKCKEFNFYFSLSLFSSNLATNRSSNYVTSILSPFPEIGRMKFHHLVSHLSFLYISRETRLASSLLEITTPLFPHRKTQKKRKEIPQNKRKNCTSSANFTSPPKKIKEKNPRTSKGPSSQSRYRESISPLLSTRGRDNAPVSFGYRRIRERNRSSNSRVPRKRLNSRHPAAT